MRALDLTGQRFGRLTAIRRSGHCGKKTTWECVCDCGNVTTVITNDLTCGNTRSCGCLDAEVASAKFRTHGLTQSKLYNVWCGMKQRCYYPKHIRFKYYGARGIGICDRWHDFQNFYDDMASGYKPGLSIERIDVNGNYEPSNCTWIPLAAQRYNRTDTIRKD